MAPLKEEIAIEEEIEERFEEFGYQLEAYEAGDITEDVVEQKRAATKEELEEVINNSDKLGQDDKDRLRDKGAYTYDALA